jgi:DNA polymerase iota
MSDAKPPDSVRAIVHVDVDAFYSQVEELRDPSLRERPMAVTQKYLVVTCNYPARARGVTKLMAITSAVKACPELILVNGEDLTAYRAASKAVSAALAPFGTVQKLGLDEFCVDVSSAARRALAEAAAAGAAAEWHGHVHYAHSGTSTAEALAGASSCYRPMDLRATADAAGAAFATSALVAAPPEPGTSDVLLAHASEIAASARAAVRASTGLRCSAGVAHNRLLAKLVSGLHKPDAQTNLPADEAARFVAPLPVRVLPGVGACVERALHTLGIARVSDLRAHSPAALGAALSGAAAGGAALGARQLVEMAFGRDSSAVTPTQPPRSVTVEDSFKGVHSFEALDAIVAQLAPDLAARLFEEAAETRRRARTLVLTWRAIAPGGMRGYYAPRTSRSAPLPGRVYSRAHAAPVTDAAADAAAAISTCACEILRKHLREPFLLTLLNLGATRFADGGAQSGRLGLGVIRREDEVADADDADAEAEEDEDGADDPSFWDALSSTRGRAEGLARMPSRESALPTCAPVASPSRSISVHGREGDGSTGEWVCVACTFVNAKPLAPICEVCATPRLAETSASPHAPASSSGAHQTPTAKKRHELVPARAAAAGGQPSKRARDSAGGSGDIQRFFGGGSRG